MVKNRFKSLVTKTLKSHKNISTEAEVIEFLQQRYRRGTETIFLEESMEIKVEPRDEEVAPGNKT